MQTNKMQSMSMDHIDPPIDRNWSSTTPKVAPEPIIDRKWSSFHPDDILAGDLQGEAFWRDWYKAGGNCDEYMKETLPNYGLVGALLLTITIAGVIYPPEFHMSTEGGENKRYYVDIYVVLMNASTMASLFCILMSITVYQQYVNAYSPMLRIGFASKFGWLLTLMTFALILSVMTLFGACFCVVATSYSLRATIISIGVVIFGGLGTILLMMHVIEWNANTYSEQMKVDLAKRSTSKPNIQGTLSELAHTVQHLKDQVTSLMEKV